MRHSLFKTFAFCACLLSLLGSLSSTRAQSPTHGRGNTPVTSFRTGAGFTHSSDYYGYMGSGYTSGAGFGHYRSVPGGYGFDTRVSGAGFRTTTPYAPYSRGYNPYYGSNSWGYGYGGYGYPNGYGYYGR